MLSLLAACLLWLVACSDGPRTSDRQSQAIASPAAATATPATPSDEPSPTPAIEPSPVAPPAPQTPAEPEPTAGAEQTASATEVVRQAYREITAQLFREIAPRDLLVPAWVAVEGEARRQGRSSLDVTGYRERGSDDIDAFVRELAGLIQTPGNKLDPARIGQAAIRGMAAAVGDSHTRFLTPDQAENQRRAAVGEVGTYIGVGIRIDQRDSGITIAEVYQGSPADRAGLLPGDRIIRVNGLDVAAWPLDTVSAQVRGVEGTEVQITVARLGEAVRDVTMQRAKVVPPALPTVSSRMLEDGIGYITIRSFPRRTATVDAARDFDDQLAALVARGARGVVLDLRGNPGGDPFTSVNVASNFVPQGPIFVSINREGRRTVYSASTRNTVFDGPVAVLLDRGTASGAEVVASALQEYGVGYLIGARSCGCLSVGRPVQLGDNSGLVVTVEQALTGRNERSLEAVGLEPDEAVRPALDLRSDPQQERALAYLRANLS
ncbi:MAG: PDZ domain-containing protein [Chloroflexi bacterium]|nr:PDZ domain-containing protein [Chloroflexota bacterium]